MPKILTPTAHETHRRGGRWPVRSDSGSPSAGPTALRLPLLLEHLTDLLDTGGVLRLLVLGTKRDNPWEPQCEPWPILAHAGCVARARRDLVGQHLNHDCRREPGIRDKVRVHTGRLLGHLETGQPLVDVAPALV